MDQRRYLALGEAGFSRQPRTTPTPLRRRNSSEFTRLALQPRQRTTPSGTRRRGTLPLGPTDDPARVDAAPRPEHRQRTDGLESQVGAVLVATRRSSAERLPPPLGLRSVASRRRKMVPRLGSARRQTRNLAPRRLPTLACRTHPPGQEKRAGLLAFRSPQVPGRDASPVHHDG